MDSVLTITLLIGIGSALLLARRLDDPIGRELDDMRGETELQALLTPRFASRPSVGNACGGRVPIDGTS
jgi:hypothetical protein